MECSGCCTFMEPATTGEPYLLYRALILCSNCYINLAQEIYTMSGAGDGGLIHLIYKDSLQSGHNRKRRGRLKDYNKILKKLLYKYKFACVLCGTKDKLTIDHIHPVSKGGGDEISNLQILCRSCNSKKGARLEVV